LPAPLQAEGAAGEAPAEVATSVSRGGASLAAECEADVCEAGVCEADGVETDGVETDGVETGVSSECGMDGSLMRWAK